MNHKTLERVFVDETIEQIHSSIRSVLSKNARRHAAAQYAGKWIEQDVFFWDSYGFQGRKNCRFKTSKADPLAHLHARFLPEYELQITNWTINERIRVRGRIASVGRDVLMDQCEIIP